MSHSVAYAQPLIVSFYYFKFLYQVWMWEGLFLFFCFLFIIVGLVTGQLSFSDKPLWFFLLNLLRDLVQNRRYSTLETSLQTVITQRKELRETLHFIFTENITLHFIFYKTEIKRGMSTIHTFLKDNSY